MFGSQTLDIAVGIVLLFLLVSIMLTALNEAIEAKLKTRAADLEKAIEQLLKDPQDQSHAMVEGFYNHPLIYSLFPGGYVPRVKSKWFGRSSAPNLPSYIPRDLFSTALLDMVRRGEASAHVEELVHRMGEMHGFDVARTRAQLENWFDGAMDRAAGWYKRRTHRLLFWLGFAVAIVFNFNPIAVAQYLSQTPEARNALISLAQNVTQQTESMAAANKDSGETAGASRLPPPPSPTNLPAAAPAATSAAPTVPPPTQAPTTGATDGATQTPSCAQQAPSCAQQPCAQNATGWDAVSACHKAISDIGLPIGWSDFAWKRTFPETPEPPTNFGAVAGWIAASWLSILVALVGWAITGLAATLGAPFWFDMLNKIMVVRSTVKPKEKSGDEASEDRTLKPAPTMVMQQTGTAEGTGEGAEQDNHTEDDGAVG